MDYHGGRVASALSLRQVHHHGSGMRVPTPGCKSNSSSDDEENMRNRRNHLPKTSGSQGRVDSGREKWQPRVASRNGRGHILTGGQLPSGQLLVTTQASVGSIDRLYSYLSGSEEDDDDDEEDEEEEEEDGVVEGKQHFGCYQSKPNRQRSLSRGPGDLSHAGWVRNPVVPQSSDSEMERDCRLVGHPDPTSGAKDGTRFCDVVYSRINRNKEGWLICNCCFCYCYCYYCRWY